MITNKTVGQLLVAANHALDNGMFDMMTKGDFAGFAGAKPGSMICYQHKLLADHTVIFILNPRNGKLFICARPKVGDDMRTWWVHMDNGDWAEPEE